ncbi:hypothetical protein PoB_003622700 [Plakobranchus ocellatus]|uniref:Uncharacterized protein n=1 Tax=Plakobranchus ocellatus TaxID=259542 RepID=A0AAV4AS13_9GAST|nr:hypothetical protein PoB_003622700 [Plakobranchus ocellatus]
MCRLCGEQEETVFRLCSTVGNWSMNAPRDGRSSPWAISSGGRMGLPCPRCENNAEVSPAAPASQAVNGRPGFSASLRKRAATTSPK